MQIAMVECLLVNGQNRTDRALRIVLKSGSVVSKQTNKRFIIIDRRNEGMDAMSSQNKHLQWQGCVVCELCKVHM